MRLSVPPRRHSRMLPKGSMKMESADAKRPAEGIHLVGLGFVSDPRREPSSTLVRYSGHVCASKCGMLAIPFLRCKPLG
jgi:hypothetical protein